MSGPITLTTDPHANLLVACTLEAQIQMAAWISEQGVEPPDTVILAMDLRGDDAQGIFDAIIDDADEVASRIARAKPGQPADVAVVVPMVEGRIVIEELYPAMLGELLGKPQDAVAVLTVLADGEAQLTLTEARRWRPE